ncbi:carbohydrate-binding protein [Rhodocytophaga rosea]|uniref:Carbohydrate-binding protein n=1 Tax=Rhodocytophaga rosea TaxID=2704465 RepID=A0A6C0GMA1_9BACT|nr:PQQ-dependent sugar dehydrogenase [Rhodocytophaga rosea]QHT69155.1 carbohydrate-binding protein [Rhodocytophaga rosea]
MNYSYSLVYSVKKRNQWLIEKHTTAILSMLLLLSLFSCQSNEPKKALVLLKSGADQAASLSTLQKVSSELKIQVDTTTQPAYVNEDSLSKYASVVFLNLPLDTLEYVQQADLERFIQAGGGLLAINAAKDTVRNWPWYEQVNGERLKASQASWKKESAGGRIFFAQIAGKDANIKLKEGLGDLIPEGLEFVTNNAKLDFAKATTERVPESNRFVMEVLDTYMYEPMEMVIFKDGRVLYLERRGDVKLYDPTTKKTRVIAKFDVSITGNYEDGMLGVALDPNYEQNNWIYINYSPAGKVPKQNVSRFEMKGDSLILSSEKIVLEIPTQRETCCHSGGHLEFGPNGDLYISTGDNTSSKESDGFTPIDERPGRAPFDAQKSSGNTHDLRGKILRIHPEPNGTYTIPNGNLFPKDGSQGKPEIYVMGTRNAFRFTIDDHNGFVYWGDVGPDGGVSNERGPQSHDEWNQARKPGNYGWPYFVADNKAYADFDFATNKIGPTFNPERPENLSPNNTGSKILPPAQKPMIWYPYGESKEFPSLGKGSRSAMAGPVYYYDDFKNATTKFPKYFDKKLFIYEWARSWVKVVSFDKDVNLAKIEPFLPEQEWYKPIDMKFGADGSLYVLQYGANYFEHNPDSRLVKITYVEGNREPKAELIADKTVGAAPLTVKLSAEKSFDYDRNDKLTYAWETGEGSQSSNSAQTTVTYAKPGIYRPKVTVTDSEGKKAQAEVEVKVGNEPPQVAIDLNGANQSFYFDNQPLTYKVNITDKEDGTLQIGIDPSAVFVSFDYLKEGKDLALLESNTQMTGGVQFLQGKTLIANSDCKSCHNLDQKSIGPSYKEVAVRYKGKNAQEMLAEKILKGGNGNWGKNMMAAHPQHNKQEATQMVNYILSLSEENKALPLEGTFTTAEHTQTKTAGSYVIRASYTDKGNPVVGNLTTSKILVLRHPKVEAEDFELSQNAGRRHVDGNDLSFVGDIQNGSYIGFKNIDLTGITKLVFHGLSPVTGSKIEVRIDAPNGELIATADFPQNTSQEREKIDSITAPVSNPGGQHDLYFVFRNPAVKENIVFLDWIYFDGGKGPIPTQ